MSKAAPTKKILYVTTEMFPYQEDTSMGNLVNKMALKMHRSGNNDVRVFMPKFGDISERKFQLHEVIRLSGMNIIINDLDEPLIIKVASLPGERLQVYFIDNEEYFKRKEHYFDEEGNVFPDNNERAVFFARGVIETIKKLNWVPDVIHINGWMSSLIPIYLKTYYKDDSYFADTKIVLSIYNEEDVELGKNTKEILEFDNILGLQSSKKPSFLSFVKDSMKYADIVIKGNEFLDDKLNKIFGKAAVEKSDYLNADSIAKIY